MIWQQMHGKEMVESKLQKNHMKAACKSEKVLKLFCHYNKNKNKQKKLKKINKKKTN